MKCNITCELIEEGKSTATLYADNKPYKHCVYRHQLMLQRGDYSRNILIGGDITNTYCYRGKIVRKPKPREKYSDAIEI